MKAKVANLVKKYCGISNKEVAINASIAALKAKKAALRAKLRFITIAGFLYLKGPGTL